MDFKIPLFIYFNNQCNTMGIGSPMFGLIMPEYPVGQELFNFIDLDSKEYEERRKLINSYFDCDLDSEKQKINKAVLNIYSNTPNFKKRRNKAKSTDEIETNGELGEFLIGGSENIKKHPYFLFSIPKEVDIIDDGGFDLSFYQKRFIELIEFCFDQSYNPLLNQLTAEERYYLWKKRNFSQMFVIEQPEFTCETAKVFASFPDHYENNAENDLYSDEITPDTIKAVKQELISQVQLFYCNAPVEYAFCEFNSLIQINAKVKRCKRCGKFFLLKGDYNTDYCDRILPGNNMTCKKAAATENRKNKVAHNPILKEYEKAYKRMYARCINNKISKEDFRMWADEASCKRDELIKQYQLTPSQDIVDNFKAYLGNK